MKYDVIIPTSKNDINFIPKVYKYVLKNLDDVNNVFIITNKQNITKLKKIQGGNLIIVDEDILAPNLTYENIKEILNNKGVYIRVGWYFQQFLKMAFALSNYCTGYYLSWDADTLPLSKIKFFNIEHPIFTIKKEYNKPYFDTLYKLIGLKKSVPFSFISEHMMFRKDIMKHLIEVINNSDVNGSIWYEKILNSCDDLEKPCFSEFETYGTFVWNNYKGLYHTQQLNTFRSAGIIKGRWIDDKTINKMSFDLDTASFELFDIPPFPYNIPNYAYIWKRRWTQIKNRSFSEIISFLMNKIKKK